MSQIIELADYLKGDGKTDNTAAFNQLLTNTDSDDKTVIHVTAGTYCFNTVILHSNLEFIFDNNAIFKSAGNVGILHYPSPNKGYDGGTQNITWRNATFAGSGDNSNLDWRSALCNSMLHAKYVIFDHCHWIKSQQIGGHCTDLDGSSHILYWHCDFNGYGASTSDTGGNGNTTSEAIQPDYAYKGGMSYAYPADANSYDNLPTCHVAVLGCAFNPITNADGSLQAYAANPIGQHDQINQSDIIHDIYFIGNTLTDNYPQSGNGHVAPIHLPSETANIVIANNVINRVKAPASVNFVWLGAWGTSVTTNQAVATGQSVAICGNQFNGYNPTGSYISITGQNGFNNILVSNNQVLNGSTGNFLAVNNVTNAIYQANQSVTKFTQVAPQLTIPSAWSATSLPAFFNANYLLALLALDQFSNSFVGLVDTDISQYVPDSHFFDWLMEDLNVQGYRAAYQQTAYIQQRLNELLSPARQIGLDISVTLWQPETLLLNHSYLAHFNQNSTAINQALNTLATINKG
ncbi:glycoside hydrolase family protein [Loigolactobacillus backii]|uniref:hypothetical protein n=1 Tax=Loigolactobacillus backii TaxID=375175 RepID=UPI0007F10671|nr:hypothetical protein [Loigolactobacillus backii]ANK66602.1 hypothetical protein AYR55_02160 [Loigolactobacillus backii]PIO87313.1 hypothetical protein B8A32_09310 [Loigolactobacillus backii]